MDRRAFLIGACSLAAHPLVTPVALASAPWDARLVTIVLRGGMDGLDAVRPVGDRHFAALRPGLEPGPALGDFYALHPALGALAPLWEAGELAFAHAVSTPYRDKRSHFDGQDLLEAGTGMDPAGGVPRDGWLNRLVATVPGAEAQIAYAVGREDMRLLAGPAPVANWAPDTRLDMTPQAELLLRRLYAPDPLFAAAAAEALDIAAAMEGAEDGGGRGAVPLAEFAAARLREETRIAAFSMTGWDTHARQDRALPNALGRLAEAILALKAGLGPVWDRTAVLAMTEFGRTARLNGTNGTDHGTGGAMLLAGGAVRGGQVYGDWPGLSEADLYARRDLRPTADLRAYAAAALQGLFGTETGVLERTVFPGLDMGRPGPVIR